MKKRTIAMAAAGILVIASAVTALAASTTQKTQDIVIGYVGNEDVEEAGDFMEAVQDEAKAEGYECIAVNTGEMELMSECNRVLLEDVDVLIAAPGHETQAKNMVASAHANNVPVVLQTMGITESDCDAIAGQRGTEGGRKAVQLAAELLGIEK